MFQIKWFRQFIRRNTSPIPQNQAETWKRRLSVAYVLVAWQAFGLVCYMVYKGKHDWAKYHGLKSEEELALSPAQQFAVQMNIEKGNIIRFKGFTKTEEITFKNEKPEE